MVNERLLGTLFHLRNLGNTVIVVEHDEDAIRAADHVIDIGPGAGVHGGQVVAEGTLDDIMAVPESLTGQYMSGKRKIEVPKQRVAADPEKVLKLTGARGNNLKDVTLTLPVGLFTCITGVSGSGKSTLLNIIGGIDEADSGSIVIEGEKIEDMNEKTLTRYRRKHLGYVFQMYNLIPNLTVKENMEVGAYLSDHPLDINDLLKTLGLYDHRNKLPNQLSGGQQQRTSIGRAIIKNPSILLCDEPTGALDYHTSKEILKLIEDVNQKYGNTVIMVTHNDAIKNMADRVIRLRDGQIRKNYVNETKIAAGDLDW